MNRLWQRLKAAGLEHILFMGATVFTSGMHFLYSIYVKAYVSPLEYGMYSTCMLLQTYMAYLQLGVLNAFNRDYPQLIGAQKTEEAKEYSNTAFSFLLLVYLLFASLLTAGFAIAGKYTEMDSKLWIGFILAAVISTATIIENFGNYKCRIERGFHYPSIVMLIELLSILLGMFLIPKMGYYAIYLTSLTSFLIGIAMYCRTSLRGFCFGINKRLLQSILISGLPLLINGLIWTVVNSIDKFVILSFMDMEALGVYGIAQNAFTYMVLIPSTMSQLFYVKMGKEYGASQRKEILAEVSVKYATVLAGITSVVALVAYYFLPLLVKILMPNYEDGVLSAQILILGLSIYAATLVNGNILTLMKKNGAVLFNSVCMCVFNVICSVSFVLLLGRRIESVALGTVASYVLCSLILIYQVHKHAGINLSQLLSSSILPVCVALIPCVVMYEWISNKVIGFLLPIVFIALYYFICYGKRIVAIIKE